MATPKRRSYTPEEFGRLLAGAPPFWRDQFICLVGTGLRAGELLGLRAHRVDLTTRRLEVLEVRYEAGKFGRGYKDRPKCSLPEPRSGFPGTPWWSREPVYSPTGSGQAAAEGVALFWGAGNATAALDELLTSRRCQPAG